MPAKLVKSAEAVHASRAATKQSSAKRLAPAITSFRAATPVPHRRAAASRIIQRASFIVRSSTIRARLVNLIQTVQLDLEECMLCLFACSCSILYETMLIFGAGVQLLSRYLLSVAGLYLSWIVSDINTWLERPPSGARAQVLWSNLLRPLVL